MLKKYISKPSKKGEERTKAKKWKKGAEVFFIKDGKEGKPCPQCGTKMILQDRMRADFKQKFVNPWRCPECGYLKIDKLKNKSEELKSV